MTNRLCGKPDLLSRYRGTKDNEKIQQKQQPPLFRHFAAQEMKFTAANEQTHCYTAIQKIYGKGIATLIKPFISERDIMTARQINLGITCISFWKNGRAMAYQQTQSSNGNYQ